MVTLLTVTIPSVATVAPVVAPNVDIPVTFNVPPICVFKEIPTPPFTIKAPVSLSVELVTLLIVTTPSAETVAPVVAPNVDTPVTSNVPSSLVVPLTSNLYVGTETPMPTLALSI